MNVKLYSIILMGCLLVSTISSCESILDVDYSASIEEEQHYHTVDDVNAAILGIYSQMQTVAEQLVVLEELRSGNLSPTANGMQDVNVMQLINGNISENNIYADIRPFYSVIIACNNILNKMDEVAVKDPSFSPEVREHYQSEVESIRNFVYFKLGIFYGKVEYFENSLVQVKDKPLSVTKELFPLLNDLITKQRSLVTKFSASIEDSKSSDWQRSRFNRYAACCLLADMYMWRAAIDKSGAQTDYRLAVENLHVVLNVDSTNANTQMFKVGNEFEKTKWKNIFKGVTSAASEIIWAIDYAKSYQQTHNLQQLFDTEAKVWVDDKILDLWEPDDQRKNITLLANQKVGKYSVEKDEFDNDATIILYRAGEIHLMYAEALNHLGKSNLAIQIINSGNSRIEYTPTGEKKYNAASKGIRGRLGLSTPPVVGGDVDGTKTIINEFIRTERKRELIVEGQSWSDLLRYAYLDNEMSIVIGDKTLTNDSWFIPTSY